jgi:alkanesulfonate monooxygenase SsuD/methylene tetrahydromethanopterin reductase-like flavin-dependent oxidoreductase (luciferase family)
MPPQIGYLLPTRERVMEGRPETGSLLELAARAERLGFDSVWVGTRCWHGRGTTR